MAVIGPVVSPFETDEDGILVVPGGAEERDIDSPEELIKRRRRAVWNSRGQSGRPEEMEDSGAIANVAALVFRIVRAREGFREPEHLRGSARRIMGVGIIESTAQGADRLHPKLARLTKTRHLLQAEVGPQGRLDRTQEEDVVLGRVVPVTRSFRPAAVGGEGSHGPNDRAAGMIDDLPCQVRLAIGDGERTRGQPAVADLVPVGAIAPMPRICGKSGRFSSSGWRQSLPQSLSD